MKRFLYMLFLPVLCLGQGYNYANLPFLGAGKATSSAFPSANLYLYYVASDLPANGSVSNWTDRIQLWHLTQTSSAAQPVMTNNAVLFSTTAKTLNATNMYGSSFLSLVKDFYIIYQVNYFPVGAGFYPVFKDTVGSTEEDFVDASGSGNYWNSLGFGRSSGPILTNSITDLFLGQTNGVTITYTNGIPDTAMVAGFSFSSTSIGGISNGIQILELAYWTNGQATQVMASNLTSYRRSVYGGQ